MYTKDNAPKSIKVDMDYCADPIWDYETGCNLDIEDFPFDKDLKHLLTVYQNTWENCMSSKYKSCCDEFDEGMSEVVYDCLDNLERACIKYVAEWFEKEEWDTKVYYFDNLTDTYVEYGVAPPPPEPPTPPEVRIVIEGKPTR